MASLFTPVKHYVLLQFSRPNRITDMLIVLTENTHSLMFEFKVIILVQLKCHASNLPILVLKIGSSEAAFIPSPVSVNTTAKTLIQVKESSRNFQDRNIEKIMVNPYKIASMDPIGKNPDSGLYKVTSYDIISKQTKRKLHLCSRFILGISLLNDKSKMEQSNATV